MSGIRSWESGFWIQERRLWKLRSGPESRTRILESSVWNLDSGV